MNESLLFCKIDEYGFPHWNGLDVFRWYTLPSNWRYMTGDAYLWIYKTSWLTHHRSSIKQFAREAQIPELLLAGVAVAEVGGTPEKIKSVGVLQVRQVIEELLGENNRRSNATSVGSIAIQLGVAAQTLGMNPHALTPFQQFRLSRCLLDSRFNIRVVAFHLRDLILFDNPGINTRILTEEQIILAGSRYNRGTQRNASDILKSITAPKGTLSRQYSEYGRRIMEKKKTILQILEGR